MKIFLGVYACEPHKGSEPEVGWQMVNEIAKIMPKDTIYAVTKGNNKISIEKEGYPSNIKFYYYDAPKWLTFWKKGSRGTRTYAYIWMIGAALMMKKENINFDIVQHITFVNDWVPSSYYMLKTNKNKFIWGPIGSNDPIELKFLDTYRRKIIEIARVCLQFIFRKLDPFYHITKLKADCIIGQNERVKKKMMLKNDQCFIVQPSIAINEQEVLHITKKSKEDNLFIILSVGQLRYIKNFKLSILSFYEFIITQNDRDNFILRIIGEGEDKKELMNYAQQLGIENNVEFIGQVSRKRVQEYFSSADLFLFPTLESAGFVILEAMSHSLPVVAMNYGGPAQFVKSYTKEQLVSSKDNYEKIAKNLAKNIKYLYKNKKLSLKIGEKNKEDVLNNFTWEEKAKKMKQIYEELLNEA